MKNVSKIRVVSLIPSIVLIITSICLMIFCYKIDIILCRLLGVRVLCGLLSAIMIVACRIDMCMFMKTYLRIWIISVIVVLFSYWMISNLYGFDFRVVINLPILTLIFSVWSFAKKTRKIKECIVYTLINPNLYYLLFINGLFISIAREMASIHGGWWDYQ